MTRDFTPDDFDFYGAADADELQDFMENIGEEEWHRTEVVRQMRKYVDEATDLTPSLLLKCKATYRGRPCRRDVGSVWTTPFGHYLRAEFRNFWEARMPHLSDAIGHAAAGRKAHAAASLDAADRDGKPYDMSLELPISNPRLGPGLILVSCLRCGNIPQSVSELIRLADSKQRVLNIDCSAKRLR